MLFQCWLLACAPELVQLVDGWLASQPMGRTHRADCVRSPNLRCRWRARHLSGVWLGDRCHGLRHRSGIRLPRHPAVSFGAFIAGRMSARDLMIYVVAQCLGAIAGAVVRWLIMSGKASGWNDGLGANGWGPGYLGE